MVAFEYGEQEKVMPRVRDNVMVTISVVVKDATSCKAARGGGWLGKSQVLTNSVPPDHPVWAPLSSTCTKAMG